MPVLTRLVYEMKGEFSCGDGIAKPNGECSTACGIVGETKGPYAFTGGRRLLPRCMYRGGLVVDPCVLENLETTDALSSGVRASSDCGDDEAECCNDGEKAIVGDSPVMLQK